MRVRRFRIFRFFPFSRFYNDIIPIYYYMGTYDRRLYYFYYYRSRCRARGPRR